MEDVKLDSGQIMINEAYKPSSGGNKTAPDVKSTSKKGKKQPHSHPNSRLGSTIEAILFAAGYPVKYEKIAEALNSPETDPEKQPARQFADLDFPQTLRELKEYIRDLAEGYNLSERGLMMLVFEDSCQLCTRREYAGKIRIALGIKRGGNLSNSSMETLSVIAYNQPVTRAFIDSIRGSDSAYSISSLLDKGLIEVCGRLDVPGRPMLFGTTDDFLRCFGLSSLENLPEVMTQGELQV